jgi:hypothetical protein
MTGMRFIHLPLAFCVASLALLGACDKKGSPKPPNPTTRALGTVNAATPASDPSLPSLAEIAAASTPAASKP